MENKLEIDLCVMDIIITVRALNREKLVLIDLIKSNKNAEDDYNQYINEKRFVRVCCLLEKINKSMKNVSQEEKINNYLDDKLDV